MLKGGGGGEGCKGDWRVGERKRKGVVLLSVPTPFPAQFNCFVTSTLLRATS